MNESYDEQKARAWLLRAINFRRAESRNKGEEALELRTVDFEQFGNALGWSTPDVCALYKRLVREKFLRQINDEMEVVELGSIINYAWVVDLTDKGLRTIEILSDSYKGVMDALDGIAAAIEGLQDLAPEKKQQGMDAVEELKTFARGLPPGIAVEFGKEGYDAIMSSLGGG